MIDTKKNHHTISFISLLFNILFSLGLIMFVNFIKKNINTWISTIEKKVEQKIEKKFKKKIEDTMDFIRNYSRQKLGTPFFSHDLAGDTFKKVEQKVKSKVDGVKKEIPGIVGESLDFSG